MSLSLDECARLEEILSAAGEIKARLRDWDRKFITDIEARYDEVGADLWISPKMWANLERIASYA